MADDDNFLSRWSRRKANVRQGLPAAEPEAVRPAVVPGPVAPAVATPTAALSTPGPEASAPPAPAPGATKAAAEPEKPPLSLADVAALTRDSDYAPFVGRGVAPDVRNAALKTLFGDPRYNVMDGLDTYIDDYGIADPLPKGMLERMVNTQYLGLFTERLEPEPPPDRGAAAPEPTPPEDPAAPSPENAEAAPAPDENTDLRLQPDDAPGRPGPEPGAGEDQRREP